LTIVEGEHLLYLAWLCSNVSKLPYSLDITAYRKHQSCITGICALY